MSTTCCQKRRPASRLSSTLGQALLPTLTLLLVPKCPMCVAVWLAAVTGVSIGFDQAAWILSAITIASVGALGALAWRSVKDHHHAAR